MSSLMSLTSSWKAKSRSREAEMRTSYEGSISPSDEELTGELYVELSSP